jgi:hypothetical protein
MRRLLGDQADITGDRLDKVQAITGGHVDSLAELRANVGNRLSQSIGRQESG